MRIGQFSDSFYPIVDGVGRVVYSYADTLAKKGHECCVVAPMADTGYRGGWPFELVDFFSVEVPTQRQYSSGLPLLDPHYDARIANIPFDIIHAHSPFVAGAEALRLGRARNVPVIGMFHSRYYDDFYKLTRAEMLANIGVRFIVNFYERCDEVWTVSHSSAETLRDYGYTGEIVVMPNGTPDIAPNEEKRALARRTFQLPESGVLLYCGQLNWKKNIRRILEACAVLKKEARAFTLVLAGQGPDAAAIREQAHALGLSENVVFTGHVTDEPLLYGLYEAANVFVFPSLYDTSGMVVREAAAMETPSIVVRGSGAAEAVVDMENGFLCNDLTSSVAEALRTALDQPERTARMGKNARSTIFFPWDKIIDDALVRYEHLIETHQATQKRRPLRTMLANIADEIKKNTQNG